jgi:rhodanese-related sulfurtransferase
MKKNRMIGAIIAIMVTMAALLAACSGSPNAQIPSEAIGKKISVTGGEYTDISVAELKSMLENKDFYFVNVHIPFEGDIANTDVSIPFDKIDQNLDKLPKEKNAKIVLYCRSDRMSNIAAATLVRIGFTNIFNLDGGMVAWEEAGLPLKGK